VLHELASKKQSGIILKLDFEKAYDKVSWRFLEEVMQKKGFSEQWIEWVLKAVRGGRIAVNLNGELGKYFRSYKGLRQGDPLSPHLFNLVADGLAAILKRAAERGVLEGVTPNLVERGLTHLQYADDIVLFIQNTECNIINLKFILFCFEEMSGMKINYHKSQVFTVGIDDGETARIANTLNCKVGKFPMKYLGLPISYKTGHNVVFYRCSERREKAQAPVPIIVAGAKFQKNLAPRHVEAPMLRPIKNCIPRQQGEDDDG
jgi:hypothetical protein